jgi:hypothetical protein
MSTAEEGDKGSGEIALRLQCFVKALEANGKYVVAVQDGVVCGFSKAVTTVFDVDSGCLLHTWVMPCPASGLCWVGRHDPDVIFVWNFSSGQALAMNVCNGRVVGHLASGERGSMLCVSSVASCEAMCAAVVEHAPEGATVTMLGVHRRGSKFVQLFERRAEMWVESYSLDCSKGVELSPALVTCFDGDGADPAPVLKDPRTMCFTGDGSCLVISEACQGRMSLLNVCSVTSRALVARFSVDSGLSGPLQVLKPCGGRFECVWAQSGDSALLRVDLSSGKYALAMSREDLWKCSVAVHDGVLFVCDRDSSVVERVRLEAP